MRPVILSDGSIRPALNLRAWVEHCKERDAREAQTPEGQARIKEQERLAKMTPEERFEDSLRF